ncbi:hypothetical protein KR018_010082 [Drosophila ironensis]|nr:hypothetical protein KR018_010082 [Drosophila ironensis]
MRTLSILVLVAAFSALSAESNTGSKNRMESALSKIVPRLLWNLKRGGDNQESHRNSQQPIIIVQQPSSNSNSHSDEDRHHQHHHPHYPQFPYYSYYQQPPPPPPRPQPQFPGSEYQSLTGSGPTYLIINPNNMQGIYLPASTAANSTNSTSSRRSAFVPTIADLLQGINLDDLTDGSLFEDDSEVVDAAEEGVLDATATGGSLASASPVDDDRDDQDVISEDEIEALQRQANRGLSPKHLISIMMQDKRRRRIQEVLAGIYLRNYNLNRK